MLKNGHLRAKKSAVGGQIRVEEPYSELTLDRLHRCRRRQCHQSLKSSTVPLQTTFLAYEPSEGASKETAAVIRCSRNYGPPCQYTVYF